MADVSAPQGRSGRLEQVLHDLLRQSPELDAAAVVSFDGLPMASALPASMDEDRVAAMSAALLSLGERAAEGLGRGGLSQVYIEGEDGTVFLVSADDEAVLVAVAARGAKAGLVLFELKRAAHAIAEALAEGAATAPAAAPAAAPVAAAPPAEAAPAAYDAPAPAFAAAPPAFEPVPAQPAAEGAYAPVVTEAEPQAAWTSFATGNNGSWT